MEPAASLVAANLAFVVGGHFVLSHPLRAPLVRTLGEKGFLAVYSLVNIALLAWIAAAFRGVGPGGAELWNGKAQLPWVAASVLTVIAVVLLIGSLRGNPALPDTGMEAVRKAEARGVFAVTRHPMMWGIAIWALAHIMIAPNVRTTITAGSMAVLALLGAHLQDRKKQSLLGEAWLAWEARTSFWPRWGALLRVGPAIWGMGVALWLALTWAHLWLAGVPAGFWRWGL